MLRLCRLFPLSYHRIAFLLSVWDNPYWNYPMLTDPDRRSQEWSGGNLMVNAPDLKPTGDNDGERQSPTLTETVKALRLTLGDTQQQFAQRMGMAISTVVRYESTRAPRGEALAKLYRVALENGLSHIAAMFQAVVIGELGEPANQRLLLQTEGLLKELLKELEDEKPEASQKVEAAIKGIKEARRLVEAMKRFAMTPAQLEDEANRNTWQPEQRLDALISEKLCQQPDLPRERAFLVVQQEHPQAFKRVMRARDSRGNQFKFWDSEWEPGNEDFESWRSKIWDRPKKGGRL
jgi:transcriptional regulator with XRE-family HTH domain